MGHVVDPGLRIWLRSMNRPDVGGFAVIIPCEDFYEVEVIARGDNGLPAEGIEVVREVNPLQKNEMRVKKDCSGRTFLL